MKFVDEWRRRKYAAFDLTRTSTAQKAVEFSLAGTPVRVYANANLSIYSAQTCNAKCAFCVEELRPASRGTELTRQKVVEQNDAVYFEKMARTLRDLKPLNPSVSVTGGEPSKDPRLPTILKTLAEHGARKRTMTTNASGLLDVHEGHTNLDWLIDTRVQHLNISRAHPECATNAKLMALPDGLSLENLRHVVARAKDGGINVRLSEGVLKV